MTGPNNGTCVPCAASGCQYCSYHYQACTQCSSSGLTEAGSCTPCATGIAQCYFCGVNYTQCYSCNPGYGFDYSGNCIPCTIAGCSTCYYNAYSCDNCGIGKFLLGLSCVPYATGHPACFAGQGYDYNIGACSICSIPYCLTCNDTNVFVC
jgi:hypothetical protein